MQTEIPISGEMLSGLRHWQWIGGYLVQTPLGTQLNSVTQSCYEARIGTQFKYK